MGRFKVKILAKFDVKILAKFECTFWGGHMAKILTLVFARFYWENDVGLKQL